MSYRVGNVVKIVENYYLIYRIKDETVYLINNWGERREKLGIGIINKNPKEFIVDMSKLIYRIDSIYYYNSSNGRQRVIHTEPYSLIS